MVNIQIIHKKNNLKNIVVGLTKTAAKGIETATENTKKSAIMYKRHMTRGGGSTDKNIVSETKNLKGRVYTNNPDLVFVEYGTGIRKDPDYPHIGTTKTFHASGKKFWYVPVDEVDSPIGPKIIIGDSEFYIAFSQSAKPFMRTAAFNRRYENIEDLRKEIKKLIKDNIT